MEELIDGPCYGWIMTPQDPPRSYDYAKRTGSRELTWDEFAELSATLAETLARRNVDTVVGIARAGLFPATAVACALRCELYPVRITRRLHDEVVYDSPVWRVPVSHLVKDKAVAVVDEIADTGETLTAVATQVRELGAQRVITAALVCHSWARPEPDVSALVSDQFVIFPWDRRVLIDGEWRPHPDIVAALAAQTE